MECPRCQGLMIGQFYHDLEDETGEIHFAAWRCVNCGEVVDPVILKHRFLKHRFGSQAPLISRARVKTPVSVLKLRECSNEEGVAATAEAEEVPGRA